MDHHECGEAKDRKPPSVGYHYVIPVGQSFIPGSSQPNLWNERPIGVATVHLTEPKDITSELHFEGKMGCAMKVQLASDYEAATTAFSKTVAELRRNIGTSTKEEYEQFGRRANDARVRSEQARRALEKHTAEHRC